MPLQPVVLVWALMNYGTRVLLINSCHVLLWLHFGLPWIFSTSAALMAPRLRMKKETHPRPPQQLAFGSEQEQQLVKEPINNAAWRETLAATQLSC